MENEVKIVNILIDEYFELRTKAEMNAMLLKQYGLLEGRIFEIERRIHELELKARGGKG